MKEKKISFTRWEIEALYLQGTLKSDPMEYFDYMPKAKYKKICTGFTTGIEKLQNVFLEITYQKP